MKKIKKNKEKEKINEWKLPLPIDVCIEQVDLVGVA